LADDNRIRKSTPTIKELADAGARVVILAHQGDTEDYQNLVSLAPHAERLAKYLDRPVGFVDDIVGPTAIEKVKALKGGELLLLQNVRHLCEEVSTFVNFVKLTPEEMTKTWLVRKLAPLADYFVCEAIAAAHRSAPSLVGFTPLLPSAGGRLFVEELSALASVKDSPKHPCIFVLGGSRIADAFSMMEQVLSEGKADRVLTGGLNGEVMLLAKGYKLGESTENLIRDKGLWPFVEKAQALLGTYGDRILYPSDFAIDDDGVRKEIGLGALPSEKMLVDIGEETIGRYIEEINKAETIFVNGPAGVYEKPLTAKGTERLWNAIADAPGYSVIGGGDSVSAAGRFGVKEKMGYVCTAGGAMVRYIAGRQMPVIEALRAAAQRGPGR
jgi:phosphoglycerate kinase